VSLQDFLKLLRTRWITVAVVTLCCVFASVVMTMLTTPLYQASTRLYVSTTAGATAGELYQGNRLSQERVRSYTELIDGQTLAQRTIDKLDLDMSATTLTKNVTAKAKIDTVLIDVAVRDQSPVRARDIANALSDEFVVMVSELETPKPGARPDARVIVEQKASVPSAPVVPKSTRNITVGLTLGLLLGLALAFVRDLLDNTVKKSETLEEITGVGVVGSVPFAKSQRDRPTISFDTENSWIAESFRRLRTNLQFLSVDDPPRLIVVTSSEPSEGKSTTAINIALALAEAEHTVVIVDGDMRRPMLHRYLNLLGTVGFSNVLSGVVPLSEALQTTAYRGLTALTSGAIPPNPSELLGSTAARNVLGELREQFDYVIVDSPPLLAVTDGAILSSKSDGTLLIARYGQTKRELLSHAVETLGNVGAHILGAVFTMIPTRGGSGSAYQYRYGYYSEIAAAEISSDPAESEVTHSDENTASPEFDGSAKRNTGRA
jgi:capsular exopolysaccharide synthesis family protein